MTSSIDNTSPTVTLVEAGANDRTGAAEAALASAMARLAITRHRAERNERRPLGTRPPRLGLGQLSNACARRPDATAGEICTPLIAGLPKQAAVHVLTFHVGVPQDLLRHTAWTTVERCAC